jgi:hypothetical protein
LFDCECYLRALAERTRSTFGDRGASTPVLVAAQALVAAKCADERVAQRVLDEDDEQRRRLDRNRALGWKRVWPRAPFADRRVVVGAGEVVHPQGTVRVRYVVFAPRATMIAISIRRAWRPRLPFSLFRVPFGIPPNDGARIAGDRGEAMLAGFSGSGANTRWEGMLRSDEPLDDATRWIKIDGVRVQLENDSPGTEVRVEALPDADLALRHLWQRAVLPDPFDDQLLETAVSALVAAGAVSPDDPQLATMRAVTAALAVHGRPRREAIAALPQPWCSLWRQRESDGPTKTIAVGAATPLFDGVAVIVDALESSAQRWSIAIECSPEAASPYPLEAPTARMTSLVWWAEDDRGNRYLAEPSGLGGNAGSASGELTFEAPLDPEAHWIELHPTTETSRAAIRISLD